VFPPIPVRRFDRRAIDRPSADRAEPFSAREKGRVRPAERPHEHHPARLGRARGHRVAEARAVALLVAERVFEPGDEIGMGAARVRACPPKRVSAKAEAARNKSRRRHARRRG